MTGINFQLLRHLLLRFCLGFILVWFGIQQVISPGEWNSFVPEVISSLSPIDSTGLIIVHGALLLLSATGISFGLLPRSASILAAVLLLEIIVVLLIKGNSDALIVRDIGLLVMALVLAFDQFPALKLRTPNLARENPQGVQLSYFTQDQWKT